MPYNQPGGTNNSGYGGGGRTTGGRATGGNGAGNWGGGPDQTQSRDPGVEGKQQGSPDTAGFGDNREAGRYAGFGSLGTGGPNTARHGSFGPNASPESTTPSPADENTGLQHTDYLDKSFLDRVKGFFGFHEQNPYSSNSSAEDFAEPTDGDADVDFEPFNAPIIGIGLSLIPGIGPLLGVGYNVLSGIVNGNPLQAALGAIPVAGSFLGPAASTIASGIGTVGNLAGIGANLAGYNGLDDALGTDIDTTRAFDGSNTSTASNTGFNGMGDGSRSGGDQKRGFGTVSSTLSTKAANDNAGAAAPASQTGVSPQQQSQLRSLYGMVSGVGDGDGGESVEPKASQGFGGRANQMTRTAYRYK